MSDLLLGTQGAVTLPETSAALVDCGVDVAANKHTPISHSPVRLETGSVLPFGRVAKRSHHHVPEWKLAVVVAVQVPLMMHAVTFRPLDEIAKRMGRPDVPMLKEPVEELHETDPPNGQGMKPQNENGCEYRHHDVLQSVKRMEEHRSGNIDALWRVMDLMHPTP